MYKNHNFHPSLHMMVSSFAHTHIRIIIPEKGFTPSHRALKQMIIRGFRCEHLGLPSLHTTSEVFTRRLPVWNERFNIILWLSHFFRPRTGLWAAFVKNWVAVWRLQSLCEGLKSPIVHTVFRWYSEENDHSVKEWTFFSGKNYVYREEKIRD